MEAGEEDVGITDVVDMMVSVVETTEMMVSVVDMLECLKEGKPETDKTAALHFFSHALTSQPQASPRVFQLHWLRFLPGLIPRLADCLLLHNSKAIQSGAILTLKLIPEPRFFKKIVCKSNAHLNLIRLVRESDCTEIRDQALESFFRMVTTHQLYKSPGKWGPACLKFLADLVRQYSAILEPTETELYRLNTAIELMEPFLELVLVHETFKPGKYSRQFPAIVPVLVSIFQEPRGRKKAQILAATCLRSMLHCSFTLGPVLDNGVMKMLLDTLRDGKEIKEVLHPTLAAVFGAIRDVAEPETVQSLLDMGALDAFHQVLKRPNIDYRFKWAWRKHTAWELVIDSLSTLVVYGTQEQVEAILSQEALVDLVLELAISIEDVPGESAGHHFATATLSLVRDIKEEGGSESQVRRLMTKKLMLCLLHHYLSHHLTHSNHFHRTHTTLSMVEWILALPGTLVDGRLSRLWHRLLDDARIIDDVRSISLFVIDTHPYDIRDRARHIYDTYFKNPLPPSRPTLLPTIIYTKNVPY